MIEALIAFGLVAAGAYWFFRVRQGGPQLAPAGAGAGTFPPVSAPVTPSTGTGAPMPLSPPNLSPAGLQAIMQREGLSLTAYKDSAGNWTIGYGHKIVPGDGFTPQSKITHGQAMMLLQSDLASRVATVRSLVKVPLSQHQFDALVSLVYNIGAGNFKGSTLLRVLNAGDYAGAAAHFEDWVKAGGKVDPGLQNRRAAEKSQFLTTLAA